MLLLLALPVGVLSARANPSPPERRVELPLRFDPDFLQNLLQKQIFSGPDATVELVADDLGCNAIVLSEPEAEFRPPHLRVLSRAEARVGTPVGDRCLLPLRWSGFVEVLEAPRVDPERPLVRFEVVDSQLYGPDRRKALVRDAIWSLVKGSVHPHLSTFRIDLGTPLEELRSVLPLFLARQEALALDRLLRSLRLTRVTVEEEAVVAVLEFTAETLPPTPVPEPTLRPEEIERWERALRQWDAFLTFVVLHAGRDTQVARLRRELLALLLDSRHEILQALAPSEPAAPDPVPKLFVRAWSRLAPLLRGIATGLPGEEAVRYLSFVAAADALVALQEIGPEIGVEISADGLRRMARIVAPAEVEDPLEYDTEVNPELREVFGFGPPLPPPEPPIPPPQPPTDGSWLGPFLRQAWAAGPDRDLNSWVPSREDLDAYLASVHEVLLEAHDSALARKPLEDTFRPLYRNLVLATAWQESCWRQFVREGKAIRPLRSPIGSVGIMQVNHRVWRGFYDPRWLEQDMRYNARAGSEIALHYLRDYAIARGEHRRPGGLDNLARATYAAYNGGPGQLARYRISSTRKTLRKIDELFWSKYQRVKNGDELAVRECFG
ncbi:MAG: hypothetical protein KatS3mg076_0926 [Candidatus Binatia bacterium]|nr:MAG: hypothetical protein KatS3mg076_0926 [Candidatus Binatia bacterium]